MTSATEDIWSGIPGQFDVLIEKKYYVYNCTNVDDVMFLSLIGLNRLFMRGHHLNLKNLDLISIRNTIITLRLYMTMR